MKRVLSLLIVLAMLFGTITVFGVESSNVITAFYPVNGDTVQTGRGLGSSAWTNKTFGTVTVDNESKTGLVFDGTRKQIYSNLTNNGFGGTIASEFEVVPTTTSGLFNIQYKTWSSGASAAAWDVKAVEFDKSGRIYADTASNRAGTNVKELLGYYSAGQAYKIKVSMNIIDKNYTVTILNGKLASTAGGELVDVSGSTYGPYALLGNLSGVYSFYYNTDGLGTYSDDSSTGSFFYLLGLCNYFDDFSASSSDIEDASVAAGKTSITVKTNQYIQASSYDNISVTKNGIAYGSVTPTTTGYYYNANELSGASSFVWNIPDGVENGATYEMSFNTAVKTNGSVCGTSDVISFTGLDLSATNANLVSVSGTSEFTIDGSEICGITMGEPISALNVVTESNSATWKVYDRNNNEVTGALYDGYTLIVTAGDKSTQKTYTFVQKTPILLYDFNNLTDTVITTSNRNNTLNLFPATASGKFTQVEYNNVVTSGATESNITNYNTGRWQNMFVFSGSTTDSPTAVMKSQVAPGKTDKSLYFEATSAHQSTSASDRIRAIKDFTVEYGKTTALNISIKPTNTNSDVYAAVKTDYYNGSWQANGVSQYIVDPVLFETGGKIKVFNRVVGEYQPGNWYNISYVFDFPVTDASGDTPVYGKYVSLYINGERIVNNYDFSAVPFDNNMFSLELSLRQNNKSFGKATSAYFDNLSIYELYSPNIAPNDFDFALTSSVATVSNLSGTIALNQDIAADAVISSLNIPASFTASVYKNDEITPVRENVQSGDKVILTDGEFIKSYTIEYLPYSISVDGNSSLSLKTGLNVITLNDDYLTDSAVIVAAYDANTMTKIAVLSAENKQAQFQISDTANVIVKLIKVDSIANIIPKAKALVIYGG